MVLSSETKIDFQKAPGDEFIIEAFDARNGQWWIRGSERFTAGWAVHYMCEMAQRERGYAFRVRTYPSRQLVAELTVPVEVSQ